MSLEIGRLRSDKSMVACQLLILVSFQGLFLMESMAPSGFNKGFQKDCFFHLKSFQSVLVGRG